MSRPGGSNFSGPKFTKLTLSLYLLSLNTTNLGLTSAFIANAVISDSVPGDPRNMTTKSDRVASSTSTVRWLRFGLGVRNSLISSPRNGSHPIRVFRRCFTCMRKSKCRSLGSRPHRNTVSRAFLCRCLKKSFSNTGILAVTRSIGCIRTSRHVSLTVVDGGFLGSQQAIRVAPLWQSLVPHPRYTRYYCCLTAATIPYNNNQV